MKRTGTPGIKWKISVSTLFMHETSSQSASDHTVHVLHSKSVYEEVSLWAPDCDLALGESQERNGREVE